MDAIEMVGERKQGVRRAAPGAHVRQRIYQAAQELNRAGDMAARVELANEAMSRLTEMLYQVDSDGYAANVDPATFRILLPLPWGSAGWRQWGLRHHEAAVLRCILLDRQRAYKPGGRPPLFVYDRDTRSWYINGGDYGTLAEAHHWLKRCAVTLGEWRRCIQQYRDNALTVQKRYRRR